MKRLIRKSEMTYTFAQVRQLIDEGTPILFGLEQEQQGRLKEAMDLIEGAVGQAASLSGMGNVNFEAAMEQEDTIAYYKFGSGTLTLNVDDDQLDRLLTATNDYIEFTGVHEYGHFVDEKLGWVSRTPEWKEALSQTTTNYLEGYGVVETTDKDAENFANAFVTWAWGAGDSNDPVIQFMKGLLGE